MHCFHRRFSLSLLFLVFLSLVVRAETYTYPKLVQRLTDMQELAKLPPPGEKTSLASSYDRGSQYDAATDKYLNWGANGDGSGIIRQEGDESVLADIQGPGCIWRTWSATPDQGHVKIYLDGASTPTVDLPFVKYFDGTAAPFNRPNLVYLASQAANGRNNYTPISFQKSCKIVADKGWGNYYQFTYTQFPAGTVVPTFSMNLSPTDSAALDRADKILGQCGENPSADLPGTKTIGKEITVQPGGSSTVADLKGAGAITALKVKLDLPADPAAQRDFLRQITISITWDGQSAPAVWSPLGDFFAYIGGADKFRSLPVGLLDDGTFYSYWYMPFGKSARIEVGNDGPQAVAMSWQISQAPLTQSIARLARFHAKWHRDAFLPQRADRAPDWTLLTTQGRGRYVGTHLHVWNPRGGWWGEGDDKFFIDGEKFPSTFGTGSEDYFGFAWSSAGHFSRPYHNQILNENNRGNADDNRWHIADSVPFQTSFEGNIEKYLSNPLTEYAAEAFWYLDAQGTDPYGAVPVTDRVGYYAAPPIYREAGAIEAETLQPIQPVPGFGDQEMSAYGLTWSGDHQLFWQTSQSGSSVSMLLPAQTPGKYLLKARFTKAPDYGIFQLNVDGADVGAPVDLYAPTVIAADPVDLGVVTLTDKAPVLKITVTGQNAASKNFFLGLDYLKLVPAP